MEAFHLVDKIDQPLGIGETVVVLLFRGDHRILLEYIEAFCLADQVHQPFGIGETGVVFLFWNDRRRQSTRVAHCQTSYHELALDFEVATGLVMTQGDWGARP